MKQKWVNKIQEQYLEFGMKPFTANWQKYSFKEIPIKGI